MLLVQLAREVVGMIPHKKAAVVRLVGVREAADDLVVEILDRFVSRKTAARNHPKFDARAAQRLHDAGAIEIELGIQNEREAEPGAAAGLPLNDKPAVALEEIDKSSGVRTPDSQHRIELFQLFEAYRAGDFEWPHVVAGDDEAIGLEKRIVMAAAQR